MGRVEAKVALVTGAARGQGRSHALRLAEEGADIIALDICAQIDSVPFAMSTPDDLQETVKLVEEYGRRIVAREADVRDFEQVQAVTAEGLAEFGHIDILVSNAGVAVYATGWEMTEAQWQDTLQTNLTGSWHAAKAVIPSMIEQGSGSIVMIGSTASLKAFKNCLSYTAAKHGLLGVVRGLAMELAPYMIRVNAVLPTDVNTPMLQNPETYALFCPGKENVTLEEFGAVAGSHNALPVDWVEPLDVSNAVLWLASDESRYVTGIDLPVDAGALQK